MPTVLWTDVLLGATAFHITAVSCQRKERGVTCAISEWNKPFRYCSFEVRRW